LWGSDWREKEQAAGVLQARLLRVVLEAINEDALVPGFGSANSDREIKEEKEPMLKGFFSLVSCQYGAPHQYKDEFDTKAKVERLDWLI